MRRPLLVSLALGTLATALWLAPGLLPPRGAALASGPARPRPTVSVVTPASVPADALFTVGQGSAARAFAVALDELYFPSGSPATARLASIPSQAGLDALLAYAAALPGSAPRLVLYPAKGPRNAATRRILNPGLEVALASPAAPTPAPRPELGIVAWERPAYAPGRALARVAGGPAQPLRAAAALGAAPGIVSARPLLARQWSRKAIPNDPLFKDQWHLRNTGQQGGISGIDIRAVPAWDTATGAGVVIGIVDDGLDYHHPDLAPAYDAALSHDWNGHDADPAPGADDDHGTAVAGLAAARGDNFIGVAGAAPSATLAGLRLIAEPTDDSEDAEAMAWRNDAILVKNNSWGPPDASAYEGIPADLYPPGELWRAAVADAVDQHGTIFVFAAGNGQADGDQGSKDGYACCRDVISVAAVNNRGALASFSEGGPHLVVSAPGDASVGVVTTDRPGNLGYNTSTESYPGDYLTEIDYTKAFAGTSAAAPIVSGVVALLLEARPGLGLRDMKEIFLRSSTRLQPDSLDWIARPAGDPLHPIRHHPRLGGGMANALAALALARSWTPLGPELTLTTGLLSPEAPIPDAGLAFVLTPPAFPSPGDPDPLILRVEHVELTLDITHPYRGDLEIKLTSPAGTVSTFATPTRADSGNDYKNADGTGGYTFTSVRHWGEASIGPAGWRISVRDGFRKDAGVLHSARLTLYGTRLTAPVLVADPAPQALATGSTLVLTAAFSGANLEYQWMRGDEPIPGATSPVYRLDNYTVKASGAYRCVATNAAGSASTAAVAVTVDDTPRATHTLRVGAAADLALGEGDAPRTWKATRLPAGLSLDPATGHLLGRPVKPGAYSVIVTATDADGVVVITPLTVVVTPIPSGFTGSHVGLVARHPLNADLGGALTLTVSANGKATGRLVLGRAAYAFSGFLGGVTGEALALDVTLAKPGLHLALQLQEGDAHLLSGTVAPTAAGEASSAGLTGARAAWKSSTRPATAYVGPCACALAPHDNPSLALGATVLTLQVAPDGRATWLLTPADGSPALKGSVLLTDGGALLLHAPYASKLGSFSGPLTVPPLTGLDTLQLSAVDWLRKPAPALALPEGFGPELLDSLPGSGRYTRPAAGLRILGLSDAHPGLEVRLAPSVAAEPDSVLFDAAVTLTPANRFTVAAPNGSRLALSFAPATGRISGAYALADPNPAAPAKSVSRTVRLTAVVLPGAAGALGFALTPPTFASSAPVSAFLQLVPATGE